MNRLDSFIFFFFIFFFSVILRIFFIGTEGFS